MKKNIYRTFAILGASTLLLTGCGRSTLKADTSASYDTGYTGYEIPYEDCIEEEAAYSSDTVALASGSATNTPNTTDLTDTSASDQKMIITWNISLNTENYSDILQTIHESITTVGGYIESESENIYGDDTHYCNLVLRIPSDQLDSWISGVDSYGTVTYRSQSQENATLTYIDTESRLSSLRTEQDALLGLMERAESMEDIIAIQSQLTNVNYEIEFYESQLRTLSNTISYATIYLDIEEVSKEFPVNMSMGQEIRERFDHSITGLGRFFRNLIVGILGNSVIIILVAVAILIPVLLIRRAIAKSRQKRIAAAAAAMNKETIHAADSQ